MIPFVWIATEEMRERGIHLHVSEVLRIPPQSVDPAIKNFHWGDLIRGLFESYEQGCDMPVLVDQDGNIAEGPGFNVFAVKEGRVTTPEGTCLLGISRQTALDLLAEQNVERGDRADLAGRARGAPRRSSSPRPRAASCRSRGSTTSRSATASPGRSRPGSGTSTGSATTRAGRARRSTTTDAAARVGTEPEISGSGRRTMRLGLFMMPLHPPTRDYHQMLEEDLEAVVCADRLGFDDVWVGEHFSSMTEPDHLAARPSSPRRSR